MTSSIALARLEMQKKRDRIAAIPVELQVTDMDHVKTDEVINFSIDELSNGTTWEELRAKLGLGNAGIDYRWRWLRNKIVECALPENEEEALKARMSKGAFLLQKLEGFIDEIEARLEVGISEKNEHHWYKIKLEGLKILLEKNETEFLHYVEMRKIKAFDKKTQGGSITVNHNYHIPRPGDNVKDVTPSELARLSEMSGDVE